MIKVSDIDYISKHKLDDNTPKKYQVQIYLTREINGKFVLSYGYDTEMSRENFYSNIYHDLLWSN